MRGTGRRIDLHFQQEESGVSLGGAFPLSLLQGTVTSRFLRYGTAKRRRHSHLSKNPASVVQILVSDFFFFVSVASFVCQKIN